MKIEDFLEVYTPLELERAESKKKEDANVQRNSILAKFAGNIVNERTRGKMEISPEKAVRIIKEAMKTPKFTQCVGVARGSPKKGVTPTKSPVRDRSRNFHREDPAKE
jgi:methyltransferase-like protein